MLCFLSRTDPGIAPTSLPADRCHTCDFVVQLRRATLLCDQIAKVWHGMSDVAQLFDSRATPPSRTVMYYMELYRENAERWLVSSCLCDEVAVCDVHNCLLQLCGAIKLRDKIARVTSFLRVPSVFLSVSFAPFRTKFLKKKIPDSVPGLIFPVTGGVI